MTKEILTFSDIGFCRYKSPIVLEDVDINNVLVSIKIPFGEKTIDIFLANCMIIIKLNH